MFGINSEDRYLIRYMSEPEVRHATALASMLGRTAAKPWEYRYPFTTFRSTEAQFKNKEQAHLDSVSTPLGATGDGMRAPSLIHLVEYFAWTILAALLVHNPNTSSGCRPYPSCAHNASQPLTTPIHTRILRHRTHCPHAPNDINPHRKKRESYPHNGAQYRTWSVLRVVWKWFKDGRWLRGLCKKLWVAVVLAYQALVGLVWVLSGTFTLSLLCIFPVPNPPIVLTDYCSQNSRKKLRLTSSHGYLLGTCSEQVAERMPGVEEDADENTPLIRRAREVERIKEEGEEEGVIGWWIVQILLGVPLPVILTRHVANMSLSATCQTLADRGSPVSVHAAVALQFQTPLWIHGSAGAGSNTSTLSNSFASKVVIAFTSTLFYLQFDLHPAANILWWSITVEARQQMAFRKIDGSFPMRLWHKMGEHRGSQSVDIGSGDVYGWVFSFGSASNVGNERLYRISLRTKQLKLCSTTSLHSQRIIYLGLDKAYEALKLEASQPHSYNSHANDTVRSYILSHLSRIAQTYPNVELADDLVSIASWAGVYGVYFEGTNILKILSTEAQYVNESEVLLSRIMILTPLNRKDASASSGGRPLLFRTTSVAPLNTLLTSYIPHLHANVLSSDAFARGVIRSRIDFSVYAERKTQGPDLAFYKGRSRHHAMYDVILYTGGQEEGGAGAVYFDPTLILLFPALQTPNIIALVIGLIVFILLTATTHITRRENHTLTMVLSTEQGVSSALCCSGSGMEGSSEGFGCGQGFGLRWCLRVTTLPTNPGIYGLGEHTNPFRLPPNNTTITLWSRDSYGVPVGAILYGDHPLGSSSIVLDIKTMSTLRVPISTIWTVGGSSVSYLHGHDQKYVVMTDPAVALADNYSAYTHGKELNTNLKSTNGSDEIRLVWPGATVYSDRFNPSTQTYWNEQCAEFYSPEKGLDIDGAWIDMNEPQVPLGRLTPPLPALFFYGDSILVLPVTEENSTSVNVYLPKDTFYGFKTLKEVKGKGTSVRLDSVSFSEIPVFVKGEVVFSLRAEAGLTTREESTVHLVHYV
ncbi:glycosyl hydrolases family 31-domain-containing protein [Cyathus striatus]|nr:glycosyl hydrolases family 31-domain-containing protein [Cyathus striatus]